MRRFEHAAGHLNEAVGGREVTAPECGMFFSTHPTECRQIPIWQPDGELIIERLPQPEQLLSDPPSGRLEVVQLKDPPMAAEGWFWPGDPWPEFGFRIRCIQRRARKSVPLTSRGLVLQCYASIAFTSLSARRMSLVPAASDSARFYSIAHSGISREAVTVAYLAVESDLRLRWYAIPKHLAKHGYLPLAVDESLVFEPSKVRLAKDTFYVIEQDCLGMKGIQRAAPAPRAPERAS
ncbi:MAG: hypothetical protein H6701_06910 [Myxococcales bacterium]|nr:hypothetical protein [Myxococcales bacterium]